MTSTDYEALKALLAQPDIAVYGPWEISDGPAWKGKP